MHYHVPVTSAHVVDVPLHMPAAAQLACTHSPSHLFDPCAQVDQRVEVRRFYRPEDISKEHAYGADFREVYASDELVLLDMDQIVGPCTVVPAGSCRGAALRC